MWKFWEIYVVSWFGERASYPRVIDCDTAVHLTGKCFVISIPAWVVPIDLPQLPGTRSASTAGHKICLNCRARDLAQLLGTRSASTTGHEIYLNNRARDLPQLPIIIRCGQGRMKRPNGSPFSTSPGPSSRLHIFTATYLALTHILQTVEFTVQFINLFIYSWI